MSQTINKITTFILKVWVMVGEQRILPTSASPGYYEDYYANL